MHHCIGGKSLSVCHCEEDPYAGSFSDALARETGKGGTHEKIKARYLALFRRLASGAQLRSPDAWNAEGELPNGKRYFAVKVRSIRAYGWFSEKHKGKFIISHYAFKRGQKLSTHDHKLVCTNWRAVEENP